MRPLQISDPRERRLVATADRALSAAAAARSAWRAPVVPQAPARILLLRLERIGDLLMALPAIADVRALAPEARIDLAVGSWNVPLARAIPGVNGIEPLDARWLARGAGGLSVPALLRRAWRWRDRQYDLAINFEPDIRSNLLLAASGARFTAGYFSGGGGPVLDRALEYDTRAHTTDNARALVAAVFGRRPAAVSPPALALPADLRRAAAARLPGHSAGPLVGVHVSGGRAIKQWDPARFAEVARRLSDRCGATIVLTGAPEDRPLVRTMAEALGQRAVVDVSGELELPALAALLERLDLFVTGDTGPMHLAAAVGTPIVAVFGPSDPARYAPRGPRDRIVRVDLPCAPCNRIRHPPERCTGHTPDCLSLVTVEQVLEAALSSLSAGAWRQDVRAGRA
jgi:lipopolysaccharide heptosyltransferase II